MTWPRMSWQNSSPWIGTVARLVLGAVWVWASLSKLSSPRSFTQTVRAYDATPEWLSEAIGYGLPVLEIALGVLLIVGVTVRIAAAASGVLFVVFLIGLIQASARGIKLECGCFGGGGTTVGSTSYPLDILRDVGLLILAAYLVVWSVTRLSVEQYIARHDAIEMPSAKRMRSEQGRRKYEAQVADKQSQARSRDRYVNGAIALVVVLVSIIGIGVQSGRAKIAGDLTAANASQADGVVFGKKAAATVDVYEDFGCPVCLAFEQQTSKKLQAEVRANLAQVRYHPLSILDGDSPNGYSTRAANAALCASDAGVEQFISYHNLLYGTVSGKQVQPTEGTPGPSDGQLLKLAKVAKLPSKQPDAFGPCVVNETHQALVEAITEKASERGVSATPTVFVNGAKLSSVDAASLQKAITAADAKGPAPQPSNTPTPTPSSPAPTAPAPSAGSPVPTSAAPSPGGRSSAGRSSAQRSAASASR